MWHPRNVILVSCKPGEGLGADVILGRPATRGSQRTEAPRCILRNCHYGIGVHARHPQNARPMRTCHVYILTNQSRTLYVGMTGNLTQRMEQHKAGRISGFTARYRIKRPMYFEETGDAYAAVTRERQLKGWPRKWKLGLVDEFNPPWRDLTLDVLVG